MKSPLREREIPPRGTVQTDMGSFKRRLGEALVVSSSRRRLIRKQPGKLSDFRSLDGRTRVRAEQNEGSIKGAAVLRLRSRTLRDCG